MVGRFKYISLSYKKASLEVRNDIALSEAECKQLICNINEFTDASDIFILSTCNRTEIYYSAVKDLSNYLLKSLALCKGFDLNAYKNLFVVCNDHDLAVEHLFRVSLGLESQVVGDLQISNQIKNAYQISADLNVAGPFLHRVLHAVFFTNKRVVQETSFRDGAASVSYATVELIDTVSSIIHNPSILVLGVGEIGSDVARNLKSSGFENVTIANRTFKKAEEIANSLEFNAIEFKKAIDFIHNYDAIVCAIPKEDEHHIKLEHVSSSEILSYKYFIDLSVPQSIDSKIETLPGAVLYNIDQINNKTQEVIDERLKSIPQVESIIEQMIGELQGWEKEMEVSPTIQKLKSALDQIRTDEISRHLKDLSPAEAEKVESITKGMMQKIIKLPVLQLKAACKRGEAETLIDVLNDLFDLEGEKAFK